MPRFKQTVTITADVVVEAEDMYAADEIIGGMGVEDILHFAEYLESNAYDTSELPEPY